jgi:thiol-disulfide isomerase/thioredoxin
MSTKALVGILLAGTAGIVIFLFVHLSNDGGGVTIGTQKAQACTKGQTDCLPDVKYIDTQGNAYTPDQLSGKVVVVNFWATWCHPCQKEIPEFSKTYDKYKAKGVVFLGIMTDSPSNSDLLNFQSDFEMTYPIVRASSDILVSYNYPQALPTTFIYSRGGKQVFSHVGPLDEAKLGTVLDQYVAEK